MTSDDLKKRIEQLEVQVNLFKERDKWQSMAIAECPEAIAITDANGCFEYVNPAFSAITGYTEQEVIGKNSNILKSNLHSDSLYADLWATILSGHRWEGEICNKRKDNTLYWEKNSIAPIKNDEGRITHFVSTKVDITHLKAKESSQMEVLFWQRKLLGTLPAGIAIESDGHIIWTNKMLSTITEIEEQEIINQSIDSLFPNLKKSERVSKKAQLAISKGKPFKAEVTFQTSSNKTIWCRLEAQIFSYATNHKEVVWLFQDISQQKATEEKLRENEQLFRSAFHSNASLMLIISHPNGIITEVNPAFEKKTGYKKEEVVGRTSETIHLWKVKTREEIQALDADTTPITNLETYYFTKEGTRRNCMVTIVVLKNNNGNSLFVTINDTTNSTQALRSLKENEERFRFMAEGISDIISLHSSTPNATVQYISPAIEQIFGILPSQVIGRLPKEFINEQDFTAGFYEPLLRILNKVSSNETMEFRITAQNKEEEWFETNIKPMLDTDGEIIRLVAVSRDITHRKKIEQQLREVSIMKDKFLSIIAHDLKNPFNALLGFSSLLKDNAERYTTEKIKEFAKEIYEAALGGVNLLEELLQWALIQSGRLSPTPGIYSIYENSVDILELANIQATAKHILLINNIAPNIQVFADRQMDSTILRNLISNAIKFTSAGGVVRVSAKQLHNFVEVTVSDTGEGIQEEDIPKLFRIDVRPSEIGATSENKGTGLGLILCQEFVNKNGGTISARSAFGQGSEFSYTLPSPPPH